MKVYIKFMKALYFLCFSLWFFTLFSQVPEDETIPHFSNKDYNSENSAQNIYQYIGENIEYPGKAKDNCQSGTVYIQFTIDTLGKVVSDSLLFENYPLLIKSAREVIYQTSGSWKPGTQNGKKVNAKITLPFSFNLRGGGCNTATDYFQYGLGAFEEENYEKAALYFKYALRREPYNADYLYNTSVSYLKMYKIDSACYYADRIHTDSDLNDILFKFCGADSSIFVLVEKMPLFNGAKTNQETQEKLFIHLQKAAKSINAKVKGIVHIRFQVDPSGQAVNPEILKSENEELNKFATQIIKDLPRFIPGTQRGKPVSVQYNVPIKF